MKLLRRSFLFLLLPLLVIYAAITFFLSGMILDTPARDLAASRAKSLEMWEWDPYEILDTLPAPEEISFTSGVGGERLSGWYFAGADTSDCGVVFAHGYGANRIGMLKYTPQFVRRGCHLLLYDHRGLGLSDEAYASGGIHEAADLITAHAWLAERTGLADDRIGWFGESWGAATALIAAGKGNTEPAWVVAESPFADWETAIVERGIKTYGSPLLALTPGAFRWAGYRNGTDFYAASPETAAKSVDVPVLLFHSKQDTLTSPDQSDRVYANLDPELTTYHALDWGAWHAHNILWRREEYEGLVEDFLRAY